MENTKITLAFTKTTEKKKESYTKEVELRVPTGKLKKIFIDKFSKISSVERKDKVNRIVAKYTKFEDINENNSDFEKEITEKALKSGELKLDDVMEYNDKQAIEQEDDVYYSLMPDLICQNNLTTDEQSQVSKTEFWENQDYQGVVINTINRFRSELNLLNY